MCSQDPRGSTVRTEIFIAGTEPKDECDVHVKAKVCEAHTDEHGRPYLASYHCPPSSTTEKVFVKRRVPITNPSDFAAVGDKIYEYPNEYCPEHDPFAPYRNTPHRGEDSDDSENNDSDDYEGHYDFLEQEDRNNSNNYFRDIWYDTDINNSSDNIREDRISINNAKDEKDNSSNKE